MIPRVRVLWPVADATGAVRLEVPGGAVYSKHTPTPAPTLALMDHRILPEKLTI